MKLYQGTHEFNVERILKEGIKGGNDFGSRKRKEELAIIHICRDFDIAKKYGKVIMIDIPDIEFQQLQFTPAVNNAGEFEYYLECEWNTVIIDKKYLSCPEFDHFRTGECSEDENCIFCYQEMKEEGYSKN